MHKRTTIEELPTSSPMRPRTRKGRGCRYVGRTNPYAAGRSTR